MDPQQTSQSKQMEQALFEMNNHNIGNYDNQSSSGLLSKRKYQQVAATDKPK